MLSRMCQACMGVTEPRDKAATPTRSSRRIACYFLGMVQVIFLLFTYVFFQQTMDITISEEITPIHKPHLVIGILTSDGARDLRDAQRTTWINSAMTDADLPFKLTYMFLFDRPTEANIAEKKLNNDVLFLNSTHSGRGVRFGEKLYKWLKYVYETYPDALMAAKMDDDAFLCAPQMLNRLFELRSSRLYYGWGHGEGQKVNIHRRVDEMFVVLGRELIERLAKRRYCEDKAKCNNKSDLIDTNSGGTSVGQWLAIYDDIDFHPDNDRVIHLGRGTPKDKAAVNVHPRFCENKLLHHKSSPQIMKQLNEYNKNMLARKVRDATVGAAGLVLEGGTSGTLFSGAEARPLPPAEEYSTDLAQVVRDDMQTCENWAVVTTIFKPSIAVTRLAKSPQWCLVIVADLQTPGEKIYLKGIANKRVKYLSTTQQMKLFPTLADVIPYKHFGRKNIGYIYAMQHNASRIWDFDDDNIGIVDIDALNMDKFVTACNDFTGNLVNPYPYFGAKETRTWPRGLPLQHIKDKNTLPHICPLDSQTSLGVVQSLANVQPDVDAIFRLTRDVPFNFTSKKETHPAFVVPSKVYTPFNAQATLWTKKAFLYMALPLTVSGRVSDIWRSYIALHFMHREGLQLAFTHPYVTQVRNEHKDIKDFNAELHLYERSQQIVDFLASKEADNIGSLVKMYDQLYRRNYIEVNDLKFIKAWTKTIQAIKD